MNRSTRTVPGRHTRERSLRPRSTSITCSARSFSDESSASASPSPGAIVPAIGELAQVAASAPPARRARLRPVEQARGLRGVTDEHFRDTTRVVEADEQLGNDEAALRKAGPLVRESHRRLEPGDDVVAHEADDRPPERLGLLEADDPGAAADEGVAPEPASLDRFEQERSARAFAQPEVGPERGEEVGCDLSGHGHRKTAPE